MEFAIVAFPEIENADLIASVRRRFDPLDGLLPAHVTLVFPFAESGVEGVLQHHVDEAIAGIEPFEVTLERPTSADDNYIVMELSEGADRFSLVHDRLDSGMLARTRRTFCRDRCEVASMASRRSGSTNRGGGKSRSPCHSETGFDSSAATHFS